MAEPISYIVRKYIEEGYDFVVAKVIETDGSTPRKSGAMLVMRTDGVKSGTVGGGLLEYETEKICAEMLVTKEKHRIYHFILDEKRQGKNALEMGCGGDAVIDLSYISAADPGDFIENFKTLDKVYIFGGGHVAKAVEPVLRHIDFDTFIIDDRADYANPERFPSAVQTIVCPDFDHCFDEIEPDEDSYFIIVTRGHKGDLTVLRQALRKPHAYLGMIGSRRKIKTVFDMLKAEGFTDEELSRVYSPIGLSIGAETPEEIGVSIAAEIIQVRAARNKGAGHEAGKAMIHG